MSLIQWCCKRGSLRWLRKNQEAGRRRSREKGNQGVGDFSFITTTIFFNYFTLSFFSWLFTHGIYPHPHPRPTTHDPRPLPTSHDPQHLSTLASHTSFRGETVGDVVKCRLFSQVSFEGTSVIFSVTYFEIVVEYLNHALCYKARDIALAILRTEKYKISDA